MDFEFRNIGECISNEIKNFIFSNKQAFYPDEEFVIDDINCCINKGSKVYECYVDNRLIAFIILNLKIRMVVVVMKFYLVNLIKMFIL